MDGSKVKQKKKYIILIDFSRMIWSDEKKGWILRRDKRKKLNVPPIIEATDKDAYEDVFRKREM